MDLEHVERELRQRLDALGPARRAELLHVLMLPDFDRADRIGEFWGYPESRAFAELLIDCEEDRILRLCWSGCCGRPTARAVTGPRGAPRASAARRAGPKGNGSRTHLVPNSAIWTTSHSRPPPRATPAPPICALWRMIHRCSGEWSHARTTDRMLPPVPIVSPAQVAPSGRRSWLWNRSPASAICSACRCERRIITGSARTGRRSSAIRWRLAAASRSSWASDAPTAGPRTRSPAVATAMSRRIRHQVPRSLRAGSSGANAPTP
jgi:hypothetical protein